MTPANTTDITITRIFEAPRSLVWKAWTDPERVIKWWGPKIFSCPGARIDLRVGGSYLFGMRDPQGNEHWSGGEYLEIVPEERLKYTSYFTDEDGKRVSATRYGMPDFPIDFIVTVTLEDLDGKTKMTVHHTGLPVGELPANATIGWGQSFDKLADSLK